MNIDLLIEVLCMAIDPLHKYWFQCPYPVIYNRDLNISYTLINSETNDCVIYLRRRYDLIHELLHICFNQLNCSSDRKEALANLSESLELVSLHLFSDFFISFYCT